MNIVEQVIVDKKGKTVAIQIPVSQYKKMLQKMEELEDIKAFDRAMKRKSTFVPFEEAVKRLRTRRNK